MRHDQQVAADRPASLVETHISWVLLSGDRAYKILKPVRTDFLDHTDLDARQRACADEVASNARIAPDVYLGTGAMSFAGELLEPVIVMRRMPEERRLTALLPTDEAPGLVRDVARVVAAFHERVGPADEEMATAVASAAGLRRRWDDDLAGLRAVAGDLDVGAQVDAVEQLAHAYLDGREPLFAARIGAGLVREVHGDLLAEDIFCLADGPRILDCLAFDPALRTIDVLADVAFLVMDLHRLGHPELAVTFLRAYGEFSAEHHPGSLAHLYVAQRALVRAKVAAIRHRQDPAFGAEATQYLDLALDHLRRAEPRLVLVGGIPGSGKSTLAQRLSDEQGWMALSSDEIRRDLGLRRQDIGDDAYAPATVARVYDRMLVEAADLLGLGCSVVLDASWTDAHQRATARRVAATTSARLWELRCDAARDLCRERIRLRRPGSTESEATVDVVDVLADQADDWPEAVPVDTGGEDDRITETERHASVWMRPVPSRRVVLRRVETRP